MLVKSKDASVASSISPMSALNVRKGWMNLCEMALDILYVKHNRGTVYVRVWYIRLKHVWSSVIYVGDGMSHVSLRPTLGMWRTCMIFCLPTFTDNKGMRRFKQVEFVSALYPKMLFKVFPKLLRVELFVDCTEIYCGIRPANSSPIL